MIYNLSENHSIASGVTGHKTLIFIRLLFNNAFRGAKLRKKC